MLLQPEVCSAVWLAKDCAASCMNILSTLHQQQQQARRNVQHHTHPLQDAAKIISCGSDGKIVVWETTTLEPVITMSGHVGK